MDHCKGIKLVFDEGKTGETYVIGGNNECSNLYIAEKICTLLDQMHPKSKGSYKDQIGFVQDRLGHDFRYAIDAAKIKNDLGWEPDENFDSGIQKTVAWYLNKYQTKTI